MAIGIWIRMCDTVKAKFSWSAKIKSVEELEWGNI